MTFKEALSLNMRAPLLFKIQTTAYCFTVFTPISTSLQFAAITIP